VRVVTLAIAMLLAAHAAAAAEPTALSRARTLYNAADYDGAIAAAALARTQVPGADAGALVEARARLERYRRNADPEDLTAARDALSAIRAAMLSGRDQVDFLVGLGQSLYLTDFFGAAADLFDTALERSSVLPDRDRMMLLDWWATAVDREAQVASPERRSRLAARDYNQNARRIASRSRQRTRKLLAGGRGALLWRPRCGVGRRRRSVGARPSRSRDRAAAIRYRSSGDAGRHPRTCPYAPRARSGGSH
jgi:hypothetical protein